MSNLIPADAQHPDARTATGTPVRSLRDGMVGRIVGASSAALMVRSDADGKTYGIHPSELEVLSNDAYLAARYSAARALSPAASRAVELSASPFPLGRL